MVKKGKGQSGGGGSGSASASGTSSKTSAKATTAKTPAKKTPAAKKAAAPEDDLLIFTTDKKKKGGPSTAAEEGPPEPPKPTVKQIIGGQSWTGKLPVNLLSEHCQKMKWERPDYHQVSTIFVSGGGITREHSGVMPHEFVLQEAIPCEVVA